MFSVTPDHTASRLDIRVEGCMTRADWMAVGDLVLFESMRLGLRWLAMFDARGLALMTPDTLESLRELNEVLLVAGAERIAMVTDADAVAKQLSRVAVSAGTGPFTMAFESEQAWLDYVGAAPMVQAA